MKRFRPMVVVLVGTVALNGCGADTAPIEPAQVVVPNRITAGTKTWTKVDTLTTEDRKLLDAYFQANASVAENPAVNGDPVVFASGKNERRYYWVNTTAQQTLWLYLEFDRGRFVSLREGTGAPFQPKS